MKHFFRDPANLRHRLNLIVPIIVFLTSILSAVVACNTFEYGNVNYVFIALTSIFSSLCVLVVILAMTQPLKELVSRAEKLVKIDEARKEKSQMMEVYQLIEKLMDLVKSKDGLVPADDKRVMKNIEALDYVIPLGYMSLMVAHEVRNPLSTVTGMTELLKVKATDEIDRVYLDTILEAAKKIDVFTTELLDFTDDELTSEEFDLDHMLGETAGGLSKEFPRVSCEFPNRQPILYHGDRSKIQQAVYNVVRNAFDYENNYAGEGAGDGPFVNVAVDTGTTALSVAVHNMHSRIAAKDMGAIFKPFFTRKKKGRGIGLFVAMRNVKMHGGDIKVESGDNGTTFTIILPANPSPASHDLPPLP